MLDKTIDAPQRFPELWPVPFLGLSGPLKPLRPQRRELPLFFCEEPGVKRRVWQPNPKRNRPNDGNGPVDEAE